MTVKQLKEKLATMDENLKVYAHSGLDEGGDAVYNVEVTSEFPSCQADEPANLPENFVIINC
jgi:hypothetical protein